MDPMNTYRSYEDLPKIKLPMEQPIFISDSTIRDGSQMPGIIMNTQLKYKIYQYLNKIGIEKLETFVYHDRDKKAIRMMLDR
ncbi:isopropylmalate synthase, partial [Methanosalsum natronophilum]